MYRDDTSSAESTVNPLPARSSVRRPGGPRASLLPWLLVFALGGLSPDRAAAQVVPASLAVGDELRRIELVDGSVLIGRIAAVEGEVVTVTTTSGTRFEVPASQIRVVAPVEGELVEGEIWARDPNRSRLFFTATGRSVERGRVYAGTYLIVLPFVGVGVTDRFTLAAGAPVLFGQLEPFYLAPKLQLVRSERFTLAAGALHFILGDDYFDGGDDVGIAYGVATVGSEDSALTLGLGWGYEGDDFSNQPVAMVGGEARTSRRIKLITENYFLPGETGAVLSGGLRFIGDRFSADVGVGGAVGDGGGCCVPLLSLAYLFGGER